MDFRKYVGKEVKVVLNIPAAYDIVAEPEEGENLAVTYMTPNEKSGNIITGICTEASEGSLTVQKEKKNRLHIFECLAGQIACIQTSKLLETSRKKKSQ